MRVLCINDGKWFIKGGIVVEGPKYAEECDATGEYGHGYYIAGYNEVKDNIRIAYNKDEFIPLSDIDETERIDEVLTTIFQPVKQENG